MSVYICHRPTFWFCLDPSQFCKAFVKGHLEIAKKIGCDREMTTRTDATVAGKRLLQLGAIES